MLAIYPGVSRRRSCRTRWRFFDLAGGGLGDPDGVAAGVGAVDFHL
jgi:hypothetical protein